MPDLSILCVTKAEPFALPFLRDMNTLAEVLGAQCVIAADGPEALQTLMSESWSFGLPRFVQVKSKGFLESVLDDALKFCNGRYVLRLDDDEQCSRAMKGWLEHGSYHDADHWRFPRAHLYCDTRTVLLHPQLWPDYQTRLSIREKAGNRFYIHAGSPYGGGVSAPVAIEHHKFLVKSVGEREAIAARYDAIQKGSGTGGMLAFSLPEKLQWEPVFGQLGDGLASEIRPC